MTRLPEIGKLFLQTACLLASGCRDVLWTRRRLSSVRVSSQCLPSTALLLVIRPTMELLFDWDPNV